MWPYRKPLLRLPADIPSGEPMFFVPVGAAVRHDERCVTYAWLGDRGLFGEVYRLLLPDYFDVMPQGSGVVIGSFIPSAQILQCLTFPGDIDVLVVPYEGDELVLSQALAIEIKVIRASFARQGKSPNQFGFSQAGALLAAGFPHVAVGHLIVSDRSPEDAWREIGVMKIIDADTGACEPLQSARHDMLPADLLTRSHGRLRGNCPDPLLGHFSAYSGGPGLWFPSGARVTLNPRTSAKALDGIYSYYQQNYPYFLRTRHYPPTEPISFSESDRLEQLERMAEKMHRDFP